MKRRFDFPLLLFSALAFAACSDDNTVPVPPGGGNLSPDGYAYVVCYNSGDQGNSGYMMQVDDISQGSLDGTQNANNRQEVTGNQDYVSVNDLYLYNFNYASHGADGTSTVSESWALSDDGLVTKRNEINMSGDVKSRAVVGKYVVSGSSQCKEKDGLNKMYERIRIVDSESEAVITANGRLETSKYDGAWGETIGENYMFSDIAAYGDVVLVSFTTKQEDKAKGGTTNLAGNLYLGVFELDVNDKEGNEYLHPRRLIVRRSADHPGREAGQIAGNSQSRTETGIEPVDNGDIYLFCQGNKADAAEGSAYYPSAVLRISGSNIADGVPQAIDDDYYVNLRELSGGYQLWRTYYLGGSKFCLQMYNQPYDPATNDNGSAHRFAIFDAVGQTFQWVTGDFDEAKVTGIGLLHMIEKEKGSITFGIETADRRPALYTITADDARIVRGLEVNAEGISGVARLKY